MKKYLLPLCLLLLMLSACSTAKPTSSTEVAGTTAAAMETSAPQDSGQTASNPKLGKALNVVMGTSDTPSVYQSYHVDLDMSLPMPNDDMTSVVIQKTKISADVEGDKIHIFSTNASSGETEEGYMNGDKEYKMVNGTPQDTMGKIGISWAFWPLQVVVPYSITESWAKKIRTEEISGRQADVYSLDSTNPGAESLIKGMQDAGADVVLSDTGTVWIDQQTGGMLKLDMNFTRNEYDNNGKVIGSGDGVINLQISQVNQVTVNPPQ